MIADREADIYEEFIEVPDGKTHFIVRSTHNRILYDTDEKLFEHLSRLACAGTFTLEVKSSQKKRQAREAKIEVRFNKVSIAKPKRPGKDDYAEYVELYAIEAKEHWSTVPPGEDPICWKLLTTHEVQSVLEARKIIAWYSFRWQIEQLFRTLKRQGLNVESSQLESGQGLKKLVLMALNAALKIMQLTQERDGKSGKPGSIVFNMEELAFLKVLLHVYEGKTEKQKNPHQEHSLAWAAWIIARIGGWKGYLKASPPGPITMKRGLEIFTQLFRGWLLHADVCIE
jgi:hypothetical protein